MSVFYHKTRLRAPFKRYIGLSVIFHVALMTLGWTYLRTHVRMVRPAGVEVAIRTIPGMQRPIPAPRSGAQPAAQVAALPAPAPRRKIGRIIEKKMKIDMPKIEPQAAMRRSRTEDEVRALNARNISRLTRSEDVEMIEVERREFSKVTAPPSPAQKVTAPAGEYVPSAAITAQPNVNIDFVEVPFEAGKIDLDSVKWTPAAEPAKTLASGASGAQSSAPPGEPGRRKAIKVVKPQIPPNHGIQDPRVEVILRVVIAENGFVSQAEIERSGGYLELDNLALAAVRQWIYETASRKETRLVRVEYVF